MKKPYNSVPHVPTTISEFFEWNSYIFVNVSTSQVNRFDILGVKFDSISYDSVPEIVENWQRKWIVSFKYTSTRGIETNIIG